MSLSDADLQLVRDEIGTATPPTDGELDLLHDEVGSWPAVALRILRRRRSALVSGGVTSVSVPGVISVGLSANLASLDGQIRRLEQLLASSGTASSGRLSRCDRER